ncbi:hypothetical protein Pfo_011247 [Paulownia fortunei]|nr:hypothetical protein Pfo_011247 [Paulownia fortunei]
MLSDDSADSAYVSVSGKPRLRRLSLSCRRVNMTRKPSCQMPWQFASVVERLGRSTLTEESASSQRGKMTRTPQMQMTQSTYMRSNGASSLKRKQTHPHPWVVSAVDPVACISLDSCHPPKERFNYLFLLIYIRKAKNAMT